MSRIATFLGVLIASVPAVCLAETIASPYEACSGIEIKTVTKNSSEGAKVCDTCKTQAAPEISTLSGSLENTQFATIALDFTSRVAERVRDTMTKTRGYYAELKACIDTPSRSGCGPKVATFKKELKKAYADQRESQLLMKAMMGLGSQENNNEYLVPTVRQSLTDDVKIPKADLDKMNAQIQDAVNLTKGSCQVEKLNRAACHRKIDAELARLTEYHRNRLMEISYGRMPVIPFLSTPSVVGKKEYKNDKDLSAALGKLVKASDNQIAITEKSIAEGHLEFANIGKNRDLVDYMAFGPAVESVLREHPGYCAIASSLAKRLQYRSTATNAAVGIGALATFMGGSIVGGALGMGAFTTEAMNFAALGLGWGFVGNSYIQYQSAKEQVLAGAQDIKVMQEKAKDLQLNVMLHPLDYIGVGAAGKAIGTRISKFLAAGEQVKGDTQALTGLQKLGKILMEDVTDAKSANALFKSDQAYRSKLIKVAKKRGLNQGEADHLADCIVGKKGCDDKARQLLVRMGENPGATKPTTAGLDDIKAGKAPEQKGVTQKTKEKLGLKASGSGEAEGGGAATARAEAQTAESVVQSAKDQPVDFTKIDTAYLNQDLRKTLAGKYKGNSRQDVDYFEKIRAAFMEDPNFVALCTKGANSCAKQDDIIYHLLNRMEKQGAGRSEAQVKAEIEKILNSCGWGRF